MKGTNTSFYDRMCEVWEDYCEGDINNQDKIKYYLYKYNLSIINALDCDEIHETRLFQMTHDGKVKDKAQKRWFKKATNSLKAIEDLVFE
jgi:hypothetical protein